MNSRILYISSNQNFDGNKVINSEKYMSFYQLLVKIEILLFTFFLGFGLFDPFGTEGLYFTVLTFIMLCSILLWPQLLKNLRLFSVQILQLLSISFIFIGMDLIHSQNLPIDVSINVKYWGAIIVFGFLSCVFYANPRFCLCSTLVFSISCSLIAILYGLGSFSSLMDVINGRLIIFGENPNSISTRMSISFIIIFYHVLVNPLKLKAYRYLLLLALPSLFYMVVDTASKGSFLILIIGMIVVLFSSHIKRKILIGSMLIVFSIGLPIFISYLESTSLFARYTDQELTTGRSTIWKVVIDIFMDHPLGVGEAGFFYEMADRFTYKDAHNLFLYILACGGVFAFVLFLIFLQKLFKNAIVTAKNGDWFSLILLLFMMLIAFKTGGVLTYLIMWYFFAVVNGLSMKQSND